MTDQVLPKWTPGPWHITTCVDYWVQAGEVGVAHCGDISWVGADGVVQDQREMEANARLIAAAPEMAALLNWAVLNEPPLIGWDQYQRQARTLLTHIRGATP